MAIPDFRAADATAVRATVALLDGPLDLTRPTPCAGWAVADLLAHLTVQHLGFAAAARGETWSLAEWAPRPLGPDPAKEYAAAADEVLDAFARLDDLETRVMLAELAPEPIPAWRGIGAHAIDYVVHGWDLARALDRPWSLPEDVLVTTLPIAEAVPDGPNRDRAGASFAHGLPTRPDAPALERILRLLGRSPNWPAA
jgi:uncharacterized protein (TIGR03086 family)